MIDITKTAIERLNIPVNYIETLVDTPGEAARVNFRGSPTLLINGIDFENLPVPEYPLMACRYYHNGLPTIDEIVSKIREYVY